MRNRTGVCGEEDLGPKLGTAEAGEKRNSGYGNVWHPNLLALVDSEAKRGQEGKEMGKNVVYLVFRAYKDGTVVDLVEKSQRIHPAVVLNIFLQVCRGEDRRPGRP